MFNDVSSHWKCRKALVSLLKYLCTLLDLKSQGSSFKFFSDCYLMMALFHSRLSQPTARWDLIGWHNPRSTSICIITHSLYYFKCVWEENRDNISQWLEVFLFKAYLWPVKNGRGNPVIIKTQANTCS